MPNILCVDRDPALGAQLALALRDLGHRAVTAARVDEALAAASREAFDLVLADARLPDGAGLDLLRALRERGQDAPVLLLADHSRGEALRLAVNGALEVAGLRRENEALRRAIDARRDVIVGAHPALRAVLETIRAVAATGASVLLEGEPGTGKELFARAIHAQSPRAAGPFVTVSCAALPEGQLESALFGQERGASSGAGARVAGAFERAHGGTLLLDEIQEMRLDLQAKLLRAIQAREFARLGGSATIPVDVRLVATASRDLAAEVAAGRFRPDLYYRLSAVPIHTPPLREHLDDLPLLVEHFVRRSACELGVRPPAVAPATCAHLRRRAWRGNVRELANAVERAVILCRGRELTPDLFPVEPAVELPGAEVPALAAPGVGRPPRVPLAAVQAAGQALRYGDRGAPGRESATATAECFDLTELEREAIRRALRATNGNRTRAARLLGISDRTLRKKLNSGFLATD